MFFEHQGLRFFYSDEGAGFPLIWAHPFPFDHSIWEPQARFLAGGYRVLRPDLRGFGQSSVPEGPYTVEAHADDMAALLDHLKIEKAIWAGLSMGGYVCLAALEKHPSRVAGILFAGSRTQADTEEVRRGRALNAAKIRGGGFEEFTAAMPRRLLGATTLRERPEEGALILDRIRVQDPRAVAWALEGMGSRPDRTALLRAWEGPVLVVHGEEDAFVPLAEAHETASGLRLGRMVQIERAGHLCNHERPGAFNEAVLDWLGSLSVTMTG